MKFWDSSAVVPLLFGEKDSSRLRRLVESDREMSVWWATELECISAIGRREREGAAEDRIRTALRQLALLSSSWNEIAPSPSVRDAAKRLLRVHPLREADALQLAAATVIGGSIDFLCLDARLRDAASREGFEVLP